ncbi:hypothetical protein [Chondromyces crocatus]|uniref:hypothetical protein n=1 Tax=Chondromyces crocatus TaxID=52 RepID=UPI00067B6193|nr:hypothetical protein [Chondromyces crocatus]
MIFSSGPLSSLALSTTLFAVTACGAAVETGGVVGGSGGAGGAGGAGGQGGEVPPACRIEAEGPYGSGVTFSFDNAGDTPVYLSKSCELQYEISACADGYTKPLFVHATCTQECASGSPQGCRACAPCSQSAEMIAPHKEVRVAWSGKHFTFGNDATGCSCHNTIAAPSARYRLRVPVHASAADAEANVSPRWVSVDFELRMTAAVILVPLAP